MSAASPPLLEARQVCKRFPGVQALDRVDLRLEAGEVLAVVGENGAGKSTLMKVLAGIEHPDSGDLRLDGRAVAVESPRRATELGIALIHQELNLAENLSAAANIFLGREPRRGGLLLHGAIRDGAAAVLQRLGADFAPESRVADLSLGRRQLVEVARALSQKARVLILDEPTSSLSDREAGRLFALVRALRDQGVGILYISHRLGEVTSLADRVAVLRDGRNAGVLEREQISHDAMVRLMVGRDLQVRVRAAAPGRESTGAEAPVLEVSGLRLASRPEQPLELVVRAGEKVGIAGLVGAGRTELLETLFGLTPAAGGSVRLAGRPVRFRHPREAVAAGIGLVPEDRKEQGLFLEMALGANLGMAAIAGRGIRLRHGEEAALSSEMTGRLGIRSAPAQKTGLLSGGNQQKVVLGKWLALRPRLLLLDEPTRGVDVGARHEIYGLLDRLGGEGVGILFASSEMEEVLTLGDRVLVMQAGRIAGELDREALSEEAVMRLATGGAAAGGTAA